jgi:hypothetical protein
MKTPHWTIPISHEETLAVRKKFRTPFSTLMPNRSMGKRLLLDGLKSLTNLAALYKPRELSVHGKGIQLEAVHLWVVAS